MSWDESPWMRWGAIMVIMGGAFMLCHWIDHGGNVAR